MITLFRVFEGIALLTLGRKLFWLFVALIGFEVGAYVAARIFTSQPEWVILAIAIAAGILGALLAIFFQNVVIALVGFLAGGYLGVALLDVLNLDFGLLALSAFVVGIIGTALMAMLFDWALIGLSSLAGAITLANVFLPRSALGLLAIGVLFVIGAAIQVGWWQGEQGRN
jgi:hypothetical protein